MGCGLHRGAGPILVPLNKLTAPAPGGPGAPRGRPGPECGGGPRGREGVAAAAAAAHGALLRRGGAEGALAAEAPAEGAPGEPLLHGPGGALRPGRRRCRLRPEAGRRSQVPGPGVDPAKQAWPFLPRVPEVPECSCGGCGCQWLCHQLPRPGQPPALEGAPVAVAAALPPRGRLVSQPPAPAGRILAGALAGWLPSHLGAGPRVPPPPPEPLLAGHLGPACCVQPRPHADLGGGDAAQLPGSGG